MISYFYAINIKNLKFEEESKEKDHVSFKEMDHENKKKKWELNY